ncbi:hypothetical protein TNCV_953881 [Trichonephila clavipes]|nr:hypothetical protein TNCV_953881 [Trichonephila clavipes]
MTNLGDQLFIPTNLGRAEEEMIPPGRGYHNGTPRWARGSAVEAVIFAPNEGGVQTSWKSAGGTDAGKAIGCTGAKMLVTLLELERLSELDHVSALASLFLCSRDSRVSF